MDDVQDQIQSNDRYREVVEDDEINLLDYLRIVYKFRKMIVLICVVAVLTTAIVSLLLPKVYAATVSVVPPLEILEREPGMASRFGGMKSPILSDVISVTNIGNMYADILRSRAVVDAIIDRFDLMGVYEAEYQSSAREKLRGNTAIDVSDEGIVAITVEDKDPNRAAAMANAYIEELDQQNKRLSSGQATSKRIFLESRLKEIEDELSNIENIPAKQAQIKEMLYELLARESELAKIEEAKSMPTIQVLDRAVVPEKRCKPKRRQMVMLSGIASLFLAIFVAFGRAYSARMKESRRTTSKRFLRCSASTNPTNKSYAHAAQ
jgi:tyrosine-protein kinase Etk/Wzc